MLIGSLTFSTTALAGHWFAEPFKDVFGDPIPKQYIKYESVGWFSNYVTNKRPLFVKTIVSEQGLVAFCMKEYTPKSPAVHFVDGKVMMKNSRGDMIIFNGTYRWSPKGGIGVGGYEAGAIIEFLKESIGIVKIMIYDGHHSKYRFDVNANGFTASYNYITE
jgi:hypothetical protein